MSDGSSKQVRFTSSPTSRLSSRPYRSSRDSQRGSHRDSYRESHRDSGIGSSSSDYTGSAGRPDRGFTDRDYESQSNNPAALQEALDRATAKIDELKTKYLDIERRLEDTKKAKREADKEVGALEQKIREQKAEIRLKREEVAGQKAKNDQLEEDKAQLIIENGRLNDEYSSLKQKYRQLRSTSNRPDDEPMMQGALPEPSRLGRSSSRRDKQPKDQNERLKERLDGTSHPPSQARSSNASSSKSQGRRLSISGSNRRPYIEGMPSTSQSNHTRRFSQNYTTTQMEPPLVTRMDQTAFSAVPRNSHPQSPYQASSPGDYIPYPLPNHR
ncbi:hypothetical protein F5Y15DRAFT_148988 [Xylariaceae sp. FL0016]|nr:hypothetical protein F5Y15DRAFT_148988 [Xylariaceae sp. FL0016]